MENKENSEKGSGSVIGTEIFRIGRRRFAMLLFERHGQIWIFGGFFLIIVAIILGFAVDYRLFILALLLVCLVAPALLMVMYYNYGLKGENFLNVLDHRIEIDQDCITLLLRVKGEADSDPDGQEQKERNEKEEWRDYVYPFSSFGNYSVGKDYVVFPMLKPKEGFLYLPVEAFFNQEEFSEAVKRISKRERNEDN